MDETAKGWASGFLGIVTFSASLPATRAALAGFDPIFLTAARAVAAAGLAAVILAALRQKRPPRQDMVPLTLVAASVVMGFPLLSAFALQHVTAARSSIFLGLLPLSTAVFGVLRGGERPAAPFWIFAGLGAALVAGFAVASDGLEAAGSGDGLMFAAILVCGLGYAEGGRLSRRLGGWQVISWALVLALPIMLVLAFVTRPRGFVDIPASAWAGLAYVSVFSMLVGFVFWYRGLALGGVAAVSQLQLLQPLLALIASAVLLGEAVPPSFVVVLAGVVLCVAGARWFSGRRAVPGRARPHAAPETWFGRSS